jgi:hypothetical protein
MLAPSADTLSSLLGVDEKDKLNWGRGGVERYGKLGNASAR